MWICNKCDEEIEDTFELCWNCGTSKEGTPPEKPQEFQKMKNEVLNDLSKRESIEVKVRPDSVNVISSLLIIFAIIPLIFLLILLSDLGFRPSLRGPIFIITFSSVIQLLMAFAMLEGYNWGRMLYLWLTPISIIIGWFNPQFNLGGSAVIKPITYIIFLFFLTRRNVTAFFENPIEFQRLKKCPFCGEELQLDERQITERNFICPACNKIIDMTLH